MRPERKPGNKILGRLLAEIRKAARSTQDAAAPRLTTNASKLRRWEQGAQLPTPDELLAFCRVFTCTLPQRTKLRELYAQITGEVDIFALTEELAGAGNASRLPWKPTQPGGRRRVVLYLQHRQYARDYFKRAFVSGGDVLYLTIMSQHTLKEFQPFLDDAKTSGTRLNVLTWHPETPPEAIEAFHRHLREHDQPQLMIEQVKWASEQWDALATFYPDCLTVRRYRSSPTMQGIMVKGQWMLVELIPYATHTDQRPALLLTHRSDPAVFELFATHFQQLWDEAEA